MLPEKEYYNSTQKFIEKRFNCISTGIRKGDTTTGQIDVIGAFETGGDYYSDVEVVAVEVKLRTSSFGKSLGQILGYSIYGERCYLAITFPERETFTKEQEYIANHLGVGLIRIPVDANGKPKGNAIEVVLTSKKHSPIEAQKQYILNSIGISVCKGCGIYSHQNEMHKLSRNHNRKDLFTNRKYKTIYFCDNCYIDLIPEEERAKKQAHIEGGKKAAKTKRRKKAAKRAVETKRKKKESK